MVGTLALDDAIFLTEMLLENEHTVDVIDLYLIPKSPKGWFNKRICRFRDKNLFLSNKLRYKDSFVKAFSETFVVGL